MTTKLQYLFDPDVEGTEVPLATRAGDLVFYGGGMAGHPERGVPEGVRAFDGYPNHWSQVNRELHQIYDKMSRVLEQTDSGLDQILKINSAHTHAEDVFEALRLRPEFFGENPPPSTLVLTPELLVRDARVLVDQIALCRSSEYPREALTDSTEGAPMPPHQRIWGKTIYSKATRGGGFIFTSGRTNNVIGGADDEHLKRDPDLPYKQDHAEISCRLMMRYLEDVLSSYGADFSHVVRVEIHLNDMHQIAAINRVWEDLFGDDYPARIFIPSTFPTPYTTMEIELIAIDPNGPWEKKTYALPNKQANTLGFYEPLAVKAGPYVFFSGLSATDYEHGLAKQAQVHSAYPFHECRVHKELAYIRQLTAQVGEFQNVRAKFMSADLHQYPLFKSAWEKEFGALVPTSVFKTSGPLPVPDTAFQLDLIGWAP